MTIKPEETATLVVNDRRFYLWESVMVQNRWAEPYPIFRFTAAEPDKPSTSLEKLQFAPGDECAIYLGGQLAISGVILIRQTSYDATNHGVMLQGVGITWYAARGSILDKTSNFDGQTFEQVAMKVIAPFGVGVQKIGLLNPTPFAKLQVQPGENLWDFLERIARPRGIVMGSDHLGNLLLIGDHSYRISATLTEGYNILRCQATISKEAMFSDYVVRGQTAAGDDQYARNASEQEALVKGTAKRYSPLLTPAEQPVKTPAEYADRAKNEAVWHEGTEVRATVTVQGWFMPGGKRLWRAGDLISIFTPMALINMSLKIESVQFTQDSSSGTLTTLELVAPWLLKDRGDFNVGNPNAPQPPGAATPNTDAPTTPQSGKVGDDYPATITANT
jgi:prophage tail gpP-like protein